MAEKKPGSSRKKTSAEKEKLLVKPTKTVTPITQGSSAARAESLAVKQFDAVARKEEIENQIRRRAYELFEERGRREGFDKEDWAHAETEIRSRHQRGKSA
jgi:hypothetical protein